MNRNVLIGIVAVLVIILAVMFLIPGANEPTGDAAAPGQAPPHAIDQDG